MFKTGQRKLIAFLAGLAVAFVLLLVTVLRCPEHIAAMGTSLTAVLTALLGLFVGGNFGEWRERRKDHSTVADQIRAEKGGSQ